MLFTPTDRPPAGRKHRQRGGSINRPSQVPREKTQYPAGHIANLSNPDISHKSAQSQARVIESGAIYFQIAEISESIADFVVPRESLTYKQLLPFIEQSRETETMHGRQVNKGRAVHTKNGPIHEHWIEGDAAPFPALTEYMIEVTTERQTWKSDKTLLNRSKPTEQIGTFKRSGVIRDGAVSQKYIRTEHERPASELDACSQEREYIEGFDDDIPEAK